MHPPEIRLPITLLVLLVGLLPTHALADPPYISEIMTRNDGTILDADGDASDWIEVYNPGPQAVNLSGWSLTDETARPTKWRFPAQSLEPGAFLIVFASAKDRSLAGTELHASFKLSTEGEYLALVAPDGSRPSEFAPYPVQHEGFAYGLGRKIVDPPLATAGSTARVLIPSSGALAASWTGGNEPFDDVSGAWFGATLGIGFPGSAGPAPPTPLAYYDLDGNARDSAGGAHHGELRGNPTFSTDVPTKLGTGRSLQLDGADDFLSAVLDVSEGAYSMSLWFKADTSSRGIFTVTGGDLGANGYDRLLYLSGGNIAARVWNNETITSTGRNYVNGAWHHLVHVVGGWTNGQRIYVDGTLVASGVKAQSDFDWQERINVGFTNDAAAPFFDGKIDDVSIWDIALSEDVIRGLSMGAHPLALSGYGPWIATDVAAQMLARNASAYVRVPFDLSLPLEFDGLALDIRYDDGFVAYLNGVEVARRNAPPALAYNAQAAADRPLAAAIHAEHVDISTYRDALTAGRNILAIQALNQSAADADFLLDLSLSRSEGKANQFLSPPTPGAPNAPGVADFADPCEFSPARGFYDAPVAVGITTRTPGALIYYTTDGTAPDPGAAALYTAPVSVTKTTTLRAAAFKDDYQPARPATHTYIFPASVALQPASPAGFPTTWAGYPANYQVDPDVVNTTLPGYGMREALLSLPTLSLVAARDDLFGSANGIYSNSQGRGLAWERAASIEFLRPDGSTGFQADCGIRMHGNSSRDHGFTPKHPLRLLFKARYGPRNLSYRLFEDSPAKSFDELLLRGCSTDSWPVVDGGPVLGVQRWAAVHATYLRDQWMRDAQLAMGKPSGHGTYVNLYLDGLYWGIYNLAERPVDSFCAEYLGGKKEEYDVLKDFAELEAGDGTAWNEMLNLASAGLGSNTAYRRIQGQNPDGTRNPAYPVYLDVENLIDYMILHIASGAEDWPHHNWWGARRRGAESTGFKFFVWDQEISNDSLVRKYTLFETLFEDPVASPCPSYFYGQCMPNTEFRRQFGDRVHELLFNDGLLTPAKNAERWKLRQAEIDQAIVGESARWGDTQRAVPYRREVEWLNEMRFEDEQYWPGIQPIAVNRFRRVGMYPAVTAPKFLVNGAYQHGGWISAGDRLEMSVPTLERVIEVPFLAADAAVSVLVPRDGSLGTDWRGVAYVEGAHGETWRSGTNGVGFETTSGYESIIRVDTLADMYGPTGNNSVYVRMQFTLSTAAEITALSGLVLKVLYDDGFAAYLNGVRVAEAGAPPDDQIAWNSAATAAGAEAIIGSPTVIDIDSRRSLLRVGTNVLALQGMNASNSSSDMLIHAVLAGEKIDAAAPAGSVFYTTDGSDPSGVGAIAYSQPITLDRTTEVKARTKDGTAWSALNRAVFTDPDERPLRISEIQYRPDEPPPGSPFENDDFEFVEIFNAGSTAVSLEGVRLDAGITLDLSASGLDTIEPGQRIIAVENIDGFVAKYDPTGLVIAGEYSGRLANEGEVVSLRGPLGETLFEVRYDSAWYPQTNGGGRSLVLVDPFAPPSAWSLAESWKPSAAAGGSPGLADPDDADRGLQRPGDSNQDGRLDLTDAVSLLLRLFAGSTATLPCEGDLGSMSNKFVLDVSGNGSVTLSDAVYLLNYLFREGPPPAAGTQCVWTDGCASTCR